MLHGDIANTVGKTIGFRYEDTVVHFKNRHVFDKIANAVMGEESRVIFNEDVIHIMEYLYRHTEYTVDLVIEERHYTDSMRKMFDTYPFNRVVTIRKDVDISHRLVTGDLSYYVDEKPDRVSLVNNQYAISLAKFKEILGPMRR